MHRSRTNTRIYRKEWCAWSLGATSGKYMQKTLTKLQKKAAELGGCAILITSQESKDASIFRNPDARISAIVYKY